MCELITTRSLLFTTVPGIDVANRQSYSFASRSPGENDLLAVGWSTGVTSCYYVATTWQSYNT
jgi:hypothetical protein